MRKLRYLTPLVALLLLVCGFVPPVRAETEGIFTYTVENGEATVTWVESESLEEITVPETLGGYPVTALERGAISGEYLPLSDIRDRAYEGTCTLKRVYLPDGIKKLPMEVFMFQYALEEVRLPADLEEIGTWAFAYCISLKRLAIPAGVHTIDSAAFCDCWALEGLVLPEGLRSLGAGSNGAPLDYTPSLRYVYIPVGIGSYSNFCWRHIYEWNEPRTLHVFVGGTEEEHDAMAPYRVENAVYHFGVDGSAYENIDFSCEDGVLTVRGGALATDGAAARLWDVYAEETAAIVLEEDVTRVGADAFAGMPALRTAALKAPAVTVEAGAFADCPALTNVAAPGRVTAAPDAFGETETAVRVFAAAANAPENGAWKWIPVSYADGVLSYGGDVEMDAYDFLEILSVFCEGYGTVEHLRVESFSFEGVAVYATDPETGARRRLDEPLRNGELYPRIPAGDGGEATVTFNALCEGIADGSITEFSLAVADETHPETEEVRVGIAEQFREAVQRILRTIVTLLNKLLRLIRSLGG